ncbi:CstA-like transporter-associated (seleno)protein [Paenibacillus validus]|uniref:Putative selenoprotein n=1 Tax=Paenibacillus validus TaxID=44253 RepID=A0A7X3CSV8_9BACL|nr:MULTISPECIES: CstA-like transporter-associated (seleno)protein [Paenibacillus]MED4601349.1 CstA-like transporter-associated (seleno)protein [Paenibacillus validus]MED4608136.1 CstA-like transporter-associated (seleno)protein [Paenibacillus validus]MUG70404.1 putative selenoprotein [Paenibacillus validus]
MRTITSFASKAKATIKVIFSIPDYEKYLKHQQERHPHETPLTEKEFYMLSLHERYESGKINRCC